MAREQDLATLLACTLVPIAGVQSVSRVAGAYNIDDVRGLEVVARIFAVGGDGCVDVRHTYHHRDR